MKDAETTPARAERRDAAENRQRILNTAIRLFEQSGVEQVSMNQIATEAQIGPGTLYRRYRNKSELCLDLIKDHLIVLFDDIETYMEQHSAEPPSVRFREVLRCFIRFRERKIQLLAGVEDTGASSRSGPRTRTPLYDELHQIMVGLYDEMAGGTDGPRETSSVFMADMLLAALSSDAYRFQKNVRGHSPEEILELLCGAFVKPPM